MSRDFRLSCPLPNQLPETIQLAHGGGGRMMRSLLERLFLPAFANQWLDARHDSAVMRIGAERIAFTTDTYVVSPLFFPGGDIGKLAVFGTVNDLAMAGARPLYLSAGFILEEGLPLAMLEIIVASMREAAAAAGVELVTGDTKVVDRGKGDAVFINTAGIGAAADVEISPRRVQPGDVIILSGDVGRHGIAIMSVRKGLSFETALESDCAPLWQPVSALLQKGVDVHCMRDLTRGGLASALNEIALDAGVAIAIDESAVAVCEPVAAACELLGLDPLYVANEGRFVAFVTAEHADRALDVLSGCTVSAQPRVIGTVGARGDAIVEALGALGNPRILDLLSGEQLPRIC
ncbi:MAG TPA: hydrogenase expression/formation protein HypE [Candidatus Binataceae bacterium]|nr:hydrogenase expression/formation protein HypE [Candidatus Binataceae bacterium]